jgi:site-specific DNA recombinase
MSTQPMVSPPDEPATTAFLYLRVSSAGQVNKGTDPEGYSIPGQREATRARADVLHSEVVGEYAEYGVSGRTTHRPALQRMLADLKRLRPTYVIVYDLSRLARNRADDVLLMLQIEQTGARLVSVLENIDQTPSGRLTHGVVAAVNEFRSAGDAEKVMMGLRRKHATGGTNGKAPIGYLNVRKRTLGRDVRTVEIDPERAPLVRLAFECYASGEYSISAITDLLDISGLRTPMTANRPPGALARSAVHRMLRDDYYIGVVTFEGIKNPDGLHQPLIDTETFERVQDVLRARALSGDRSRKHEHYLKGSIFCGQCGSRLLFMPVKGNGGHYEYFGCQGRRRPGVECCARHLSVDEVDRAVERYYQRSVGLTPAAQNRVRTAVQRYAERKLRTAHRERERAAQRLDTLKREQQRLLHLSYRDLVDVEVLAAEQARIKSERAQVAKWVKAATHDVEEVAEALDEALRLLDKPGVAYRRATPLIRRMFNQSLFEGLLILDGEVVASTPTPWAKALERLARQRRKAHSAPHQQIAGSLQEAISAQIEARNDHDPLSGGHGLNVKQMVRLRGLEPPRGCPHTDLNRARLPIPPQPQAPKHDIGPGSRSARRRGMRRIHGPPLCYPPPRPCRYRLGD